MIMNREPGQRWVVITGASSGIGQACALGLHRAGFRVFAGVRTEADAQAVRQHGSEGLQPLFLDVTVPESIAAAQEAVTTAVQPGGLYGLVNNAGYGLGGPLEFLALDDIRQQLEVNLLGAIAVTQAFLPLLRRARGRIVNMSSFGGLVAMPFFGPYSASKFALEAVSDAWRVELRPWGIAVSLVEPRVVATPIWEKGARMASQALQAMPPQMFELYGPALLILEKIEGLKEHGIPPAQVSGAVEHALLAPRPRARYPVGSDARILALLRFLPVRLRDWFLAQRLPAYP
jgi:NAD(P)-dependent dehydrogenase (short-subunit alcohol dehydrogenase family)